MNDEDKINLANALTAFIGRPLDNPLSRSEIMECARIALSEIQRINPQLFRNSEHVISAYRLPAGWRMVPIEPTEEMIAAGDQFMDGLSRLGDAYDAMLAAAPEAP